MCAFETSTFDEPLRAVICKGLHWIEIDTHEDLKRARTDVYPLILQAAPGRHEHMTSDYSSERGLEMKRK